MFSLYSRNYTRVSRSGDKFNPKNYSISKTAFGVAKFKSNCKICDLKNKIKNKDHSNSRSSGKISHKSESYGGLRDLRINSKVIKEILE